MPSSTGSVMTQALSELGGAALSSGIDLWTRAWEVSTRHVTTAFVPPSTTHPESPSDAGLPGAWRRYLSEMAMVPGLALERFAAELSAPPVHEALPRIPGAPVTVPARVAEATQGLAVYAVPAAPVRDLLRDRKVPFVPVDLGHGLTALALTGVRYRKSELGTYDEVGLAFVVSPASDRPAIGLYFDELPVTGHRSRVAGRTIWGYAKTEETITVDIDGPHASWTWRRPSGRHVLTITFPRGGRGGSSTVGIPTYTMRNGRPYCTVFVRSGRGERVEAGGNGVRLEIGRGRAGASDRVVASLRRLGVQSAPVILHAWTEQMSGLLGYPQPTDPAPSPDAAVSPGPAGRSGRRTSRRS